MLEKVAGKRVILSLSGGRDSAAASLYLREQGIEHERVFADTGWEAKETYEYLRGPLTAALGPIVEVRAERGFIGLVKHKGIFPDRSKRFCTEDLKMKPIRAWMRASADEREIVNVVGIRREESAARASAARASAEEWSYSDYFDCDVWKPLVSWSAADVAAIHERHGLPMNPLYALGASRVGCWPCIHARKAEIALVAQHDPERIDLIDQVERDLTAAATAEAEAEGKPLDWERSLFSIKVEGKHIPMPIRDAVRWAQRSRRANTDEQRRRRLPMAELFAMDDGCARAGLCER